MVRPLIAALLLIAAPASAGPAGDLTAESRAGLDLRQRLGVPSPASPTIVYLHSEASHYTRITYLRIAARDAQGQWTISGAGEELPQLMSIEPHAMPEERRTLSPEDGRKLDRLLARPALFREKSPRPRDVQRGAAFYTMEMVTPRHHGVIRWAGRLSGNGGAVADLIMGIPADRKGG